MYPILKSEIWQSVIPPLIAAIVTIVGFYWIAHRQNQLARQGQFETSFFNLLKDFRELTNRIEGPISETPKEKMNPLNSVSGMGPDDNKQDFFNEANYALRHIIDDYLHDAIIGISAKTKLEQQTTIRNATVKAYDDFFDQHSPQLSHYLRYLYNIMKFVDRAKSIKNKADYMNFIQATMSPGELGIVFYNGIGKYGKKAYEIIKRYNFLENLDPDKISEHTNPSEFYPQSNFRFQRMARPFRKDV